MDYIDRLTALRIDNDKKQKTIAEILNVQQSAISKYEKRRAELTIEQLIILCKFYNVSADYILGLPKGLEYPERTPYPPLKKGEFVKNAQPRSVPGL